ncbi:hypothetical protein V6N13_028675 [Hibiscus sabdariffa]
MSIGETFPGRSDGGRDSGRLERGSRPNELLELQRKGQALTIWGGLRKQAVNNGLIMISQNKREHANDRNVIVIQWEKTITMQAWVLGRIKRFGPHRRRKENLNGWRLGSTWRGGGPPLGVSEPLDVHQNKG